MLIKRIQIEDFEGIDHFESSFDSQLAVLSPEIADTFVKAIGVILKSKYLAGGDVDVKKSTVIKAEIEISETVYYISATGLPDAKSFDYVVTTKEGNPCDDFYEMIHQSQEEERLSCFTYDRKNRFSDKFKYYKDSEKYYSKKEFSGLTDGIGDTRLFRACLNDHIKRSNQDFSKDGIGAIIIDDTGRMVLDGKPSPFERELLSESDSVVFEFLSFLNVCRFWQEIEEIRDLNHINWPVIIFDLAESLGDSKALSDYVKEALLSNRQIFICDKSKKR